MQISLYIGERRKKDKIVNEELLKYIEGDRSDRIKDLILKGLIFEGDKSIDEKLLDMRYIYNNLSSIKVDTQPVAKKFSKDSQLKPKTIEESKPDFSRIKIEKRNVIDDDLESRI